MPVKHLPMATASPQVKPKKRLPDWFRTRLPNGEQQAVFNTTKAAVKDNKLHTKRVDPTNPFPVSLSDNDDDNNYYYYSKRFAHSAGPLTLRVQALPEGSFLCAKTVSKWCPKTAKMDPAATVIHSKLRNGTKWRQGVVFVNVCRPFWSFLGTQKDSENPSRIDFLLKSVFHTYYF